MEWYKEQSAELKIGHPELTDKELIGFAKKKFDEIYSKDTNGHAASTTDTSTAKRKSDAVNGSEQLSGVAKLAKFSFKK